MSSPLVKRFNKTLFDFFKQIIAIYPDVKVFYQLRTQLRMGLTTNEKLAITNFYTHLVKEYKQQILSQDESFFLDFDLTGTVLSDLNYLKVVFKDATPNTKVALWKYVKVLTILSEKLMT